MIILSGLVLSLTVIQILSQDVLQSQFPLYGLSEIAAKKGSKVKSSCQSQLKNVYYGIKKHETWALRLLDSSGSPVNGFIWGNNYWMGTYSQCRLLSSKKSKLTSAVQHRALGFPPFGVDFYISLFKQNTILQAQLDLAPKDLIHLGLCLPSVCSTEDLEPLLNLWAKENPLTVQSLYNFTLEFQNVRVVRPDFSWIYNPITIILTVILTIVVLLTFFGTFYDIYIWRPKRKRQNFENEFKNNNKPIEFIKPRNIQECADLLHQDNNLNECYELKIDNSEHKSIPTNIKPTQVVIVEQPNRITLYQLSLCFSATLTMKKIFKMSKKGDELGVVHGLRFFGMVWLIWLYSVFYLKYYADNRPVAQRLSEGFSEHIISNSTFSVDTFFFTGGFILALKYYKNRRSSLKTERNFSIKKKVNEFGLTVFKRLMRLTPVYMVVLAVVIICVKSIRQTSLFNIEEPADEICEKYWWRNFIYINNLFKGDEMCMSWSWYLSTDMQFFLVGLFILILSTRFWKFTSFMAIIMIIMSSLITGYLSYGNRYIPTNLQPKLSLLHVLHYSPWTRVGPYLIGMFTGYFVVHLKGELIIKRATLISCWLMWTLCNIWALFGLYSKNMSMVSTALHTALSRTAWGFGLSWLVIACCTKNAGAIKAILSYPGWIPFSRLSYSAYLLSPLIINVIISNAETAMHLDFFQIIVYFFGHLGITYFCAFFFSLVLEIPLATLGKLAIGGIFVIIKFLKGLGHGYDIVKFNVTDNTYNLIKESQDLLLEVNSELQKASLFHEKEGSKKTSRV